MDPKLMSKETCWAMMDVLTLGLNHELIEDAEAVLLCLRAMRPGIAEFDTYEAWILMKRGFYKDATRLLMQTATSASGGLQSRALLSYCQYVSGDAQWMHNAQQVLEDGSDEDSSYLMRLLINPEEAMQAKEMEESLKAQADLEPANPPLEVASYATGYLRA